MSIATSGAEVHECSALSSVRTSHRLYVERWSFAGWAIFIADAVLLRPTILCAWNTRVQDLVVCLSALTSSSELT
jgi:hypothetical protein